MSASVRTWLVLVTACAMLAEGCFWWGEEDPCEWVLSERIPFQTDRERLSIMTCFNHECVEETGPAGHTSGDMRVWFLRDNSFVDLYPDRDGRILYETTNRREDYAPGDVYRLLIADPDTGVILHDQTWTATSYPEGRCIQAEVEP